MRRLLAFLRRRRRPEGDFADEIGAHLAIEAERLVATGLSPEAASLEARRRFGNVTRQQEDFHLRRSLGRVEDLPALVRRTVRRLVAAPLFSLSVIATLALGIGAATAVFGLVDAVLLRPLPFPRADRLVVLSHTLTLQGVSRVDQSDATYLYYRRASHTLSGAGAYQTVSVNLGVKGEAGAERVEGARVTASLLATLGVTPLRGRLFRDEEDRPGGPAIAILGERLWRRDFGGDPAIIGQRVPVDGVPREVIGVLPDRFAFPEEGTELWLPAEVDPSHTESATFDYKVVARLLDGVTLGRARADLQALLPHVPEAFPGRLTADAIRITRMQVAVQPLRDAIVGGVGPALWIVLGAAAFLLLTACANIANLFLVRAEERQHDTAVRRALGAGRWALVTDLFSEGLLLAIAGGGLGLLLAAAALGILRASGPALALPRLQGLGLNGTVIAVAAGVTIVAALLMSVIPALRSDPGAAAVLAQTGRSTTAGRQRHRVRRVLVAVQVALGFILAAGAALMAQSFRQLRAVPAGFDATRAYTFRIALPDGQYPTSADAASLVDRLLSGIGSLPGVTSAGVLSKLPLADAGRLDTAVFVEDRPVAMGAMPNVHQIVHVTAGTFAALGIPLVAGRTFAPSGPAQAPLEVLVTRNFAARYWPHGDPVGRRIRFAIPDGPWFTIIGVTGDVRTTRLDAAPDELVFLPLVTAPGPAAMDGGAGPARYLPRTLAVVVAGRGDPRALAAPVTGLARTLAPGAPVYAAQPMEAVVGRSLARTTFTLLLLRIAALAALLIAAVGIYGVVAYLVRLRLKELAVRLALGAGPAALRRLVLGQAGVVIGLGLLVGVAGALLLTRVMTGLLFNVAPSDPAALGWAVATMALVALVASWIPAARAAATDPAVILRADA